VATALAVGTGRVEASTRQGGTGPFIADTARILVVEACSFLRPHTLGSTYSGRIDSSTCQNFLGFPTVEQFRFSANTVSIFNVRLNAAFTASLVQLNIGSAFFGLPPIAGVSEGIAVVAPGTYGFLVSGVQGASGSYTVTSLLNPDPRQGCLITSATRGVSFATALTPSCTQRELRVLPRLAPGQLLRVTASAPSFPITVQIRQFDGSANGVLLAQAVASTSGGSAVVSYNGATDFIPIFIRIVGPPASNDVVQVTIDP
jgi:hypothetical protein